MAVADIQFSQEQLDQMVAKIKAYFRSELDQDIGAFEAEFLIDFFAKAIGPHFYNQGLADAHKTFIEQVEEATYRIEELEQSSP